MAPGRSLRRGALALLLLAGCLFHQAVAAQDPVGPRVAIIDMQLILRESAAVRAMQSELDQLRTRYQGEIKAMEEEIRRASQDLTRQRSVLSAEAYGKRRQELEREVSSLQRSIKEQRRGLDQLFARGMDQVRQALVEVVKEIAQERGADLVLSKANVVLVRPDLEITETAIERLDRRLPEVSLELPQN